MSDKKSAEFLIRQISNGGVVQVIDRISRPSDGAVLERLIIDNGRDGAVVLYLGEGHPDRGTLVKGCVCQFKLSKKKVDKLQQTTPGSYIRINCKNLKTGSHL